MRDAIGIDIGPGWRSVRNRHQWYSNGEAIGGATSATYTWTPNEGGELVSVVVRYTDDTGLADRGAERSASGCLALLQLAFMRSLMARHAKFLLWMAQAFCVPLGSGLRERISAWLPCSCRWSRVDSVYWRLYVDEATALVLRPILVPWSMRRRMRNLSHR